MRTLPILAFLALAAIAGAQSLTLDQAIRTARSNRPAFEAARLRVSEATHSRRAMGAYPGTMLSLGYTSDDEIPGGDDDFILSQPLDIFGRSAAFRASGQAHVARAEAAYRQVAAEVQAEVVHAYVEAATSAELAHAAGEVQATLQKLFDATKARVDEGVIPGIQLTRVGVELDQAKLRSDQRQAELKANLQRLAAVIGADARPSLAESFPELPVTPVDESRLLRQRSDLLLLATDRRIAESDARVARLGLLPELELQARRTPWSQSDARYGLRLQLSIPLFDNGRTRSETKAASTRAEAAQKSLADAMKRALGEIAAANIEVESARDQVTRYQALIVTARQVAERLRPALTDQATTLLEVIDATRSFREVEEGLIEAKRRLAEAQARYLHATGQLIEVRR